MAVIPIPEIILFDTGVSRDYRGKNLGAETVLKDILIEFDGPCADAVQLTFRLWPKDTPKKLMVSRQGHTAGNNITFRLSIR